MNEISVQVSNAFSLIISIEELNFKLVIFKQNRKAYTPISLTEFGIINSPEIFKLSNAQIPIFLTEFPNFKPEKFLHPIKADFLIYSTESGMFNVPYFNELIVSFAQNSSLFLINLCCN
jgi:hypothetical protein